MKRERAKEILIDVLRTINSEEQEFNVSTEDFTEAMLLAIEIL
jgi:hypothetical protein